MHDLRIKAMDYALQARANAEQDVVQLAERIYAFLSPQPPELRKPLPFGFRSPDHGSADQSPVDDLSDILNTVRAQVAADVIERDADGIPTRLLYRVQDQQFSE